MSTRVPISPRIASTARSRVQPAAEAPFTSITWSPVRIPARSAGESLHGGDQVIQPFRGIHLEAEAAVIAGGPLQVPPQILPLQQPGVGIVQLLEHSARGSEVQLGFGERIHVEVPNVVQHVLEYSGVLVSVTPSSQLPLQDPATVNARDHREDSGNHPPSAHGISSMGIITLTTPNKTVA
jgi:hypothetical protein